MGHNWGPSLLGKVGHGQHLCIYILFKKKPTLKLELLLLPVQVGLWSNPGLALGS